MADIRHTSEIFGIPSNQLLCNNLKNALHRNDGVFFIATLNDQLVYIKAFFHDRPRIAVDTQMLLLSVDWQAWKAWNLLNSESLEHRIDAFNNRGLLLCRQFYQPHVFMFCGMDELLETWRTGDFQSPPSCPLLPFRQSHHLSQHVSTSTFIQLSGKTMQSEDEKPLHCLLLQGKRILASIPARVLLSVPRWGFNLLPDCLLPGESNEKTIKWVAFSALPFSTSHGVFCTSVSFVQPKLNQTLGPSFAGQRWRHPMPIQANWLLIKSQGKSRQ